MQWSRISQPPLKSPGSPGGSGVKNLPASAGDTSSIPRSERSSGEGNDNPLHILAWEIPWTEEPGGVQSWVTKRRWSDETTDSNPGSKHLETAFVKAFKNGQTLCNHDYGSLSVTPPAPLPPTGSPLRLGQPPKMNLMCTTLESQERLLCENSEAARSWEESQGLQGACNLVSSGHSQPVPGPAAICEDIEPLSLDWYTYAAGPGHWRPGSGAVCLVAAAWWTQHNSVLS